MISEAMNIPLTLPPASNPRQMDMPPRTGGDFVMPPRRPDGAVPISGIRPNVPLGSSQRTTFMGSYPLGRSVDMADVCSRLMDSGEQSDRSLLSSAVLFPLTEHIYAFPMLTHFEGLACAAVPLVSALQSQKHWCWLQHS